jgi:hypothetical protein
MIRILLLLAALPFVAPAQLQLYVAPPNSETALTSFYDQGTVATGDSLDTRYRVRNHGVSAVTITKLGVAGAGFKLIAQPSLPYTIAPGLNLDFTVRFQASEYGSYSANLSVNSISLLVRATALAGVTVKANGSVVSAGASIDLGRAERGGSTAMPFELVNATTQTVPVRSVQVTGVAFRLDNAPAITELPAGAAVPFVIRFQPAAAGVFTGLLSIDGREFRLTGAASEPPFTRPSVVLDTFTSESARQGRVSVRFPSPSKASGDGTLQILFQPAAGIDNDSGILFPASGGRTIPLKVNEGDVEARFGETPQAVFQTGTTAGTIVLTAMIGGFTEQTSVVIPAAAVKFDQTAALKNGSSLEVQLSGFDNTQSTGNVSFTFYDRGGQAVQPGAIRVNARDDFKRYFDASKLGGTFQLRATFPVAGSISNIESVEVEFTNTAGGARTSRLRF